MKIECQRCGTTYRIADEKVQGRKVFKVRCRTCSSEVIVRGTDHAAEASPATATDAVWHVVLDGEPRGPFRVDQVSEMVAQGDVDAEAYAWRDGFDGWSPLREVVELASVFSRPSSQPLFSGDEVATGPRSESSVLFSLATLQQLSGPNSRGAKSERAVDDLLTVGASGGLSSPLAAPVLAPVAVPAATLAAPLAPPPPAAGSLTGAIVAAAVIVALGGLGAVALYVNRREPPAAPVVASNADPRATTAALARPERAPAPAARTESAPASTPPSVAPSGPESNGHRDRARDRSRGRDHGSSPAVPAPSIVPSSSVAPAPRRPETVEAMMDRTVVGVAPSRPTPPAPPAPVAAGLPARSDVAAAMRGVGPAVRACGTGQGGTATVTVVFNGQGGVNTANVAPPAAGTPVGSCIARAVRSAHLPPFGRPTFSVTFPFALD